MDQNLELSLLQDTYYNLDKLIYSMKNNFDNNEIDYIITKVDNSLHKIYNFLENDSDVSNNWNSVICSLENGLRVLIQLQDEKQISNTLFQVGRPKFHIPFEKLEYLISLGFKLPVIATMFGVCTKTVSRRLHEHGFSMLQKYSSISDEELESCLSLQLLSHPNTGYKRMKGYLLAGGIRVTDLRVREAMRVVDPVGVALRTQANRAIIRREYYVAFSNSMWHIDGNHKLIRWGFVVRGGIDGKSRTITYLVATADNRADTHLVSFLEAVQNFGIPQRCRSDKGGENFLIARFMLENRGIGRGSHICGRSVHNQRIERLWRDVFYGCLSTYYNLFQKMEFDEILNPDNLWHIYILHKVFLPRLNRDLGIFMNGWNHHPLSTEGNYSPIQLMCSTLPPPLSDLFPENLPGDDVLIHDLDDLEMLDEFHPGTVVNDPATEFNVTEFEAAFQQHVDPLASSESFGYDIYLAALNALVNYTVHYEPQV